MRPALQNLFSGKISSLILLSILIFTATASSTHQLPLTDADKKQILSLLFKDELAALESKELVILLSPRTDASWLIELPGIRFKKLSYEEENQASEYYELSSKKIDSDYVEVWLSKGNYCKKVGAEHLFRKEHGQWTVKTPRFSESFSSPGTACTACKTGSGSVYELKNKTARVLKERKDLVLRGKVLATSCERSKKKYVRCKIEVSLDFVNQGTQPIIILEPHGEYELWQGARLLSLTKAESEANNYVYSSAAWPSFSKTDLYRQLAQGLDQANPPANLTRTIASGDSWNWKTTIQLGLAEDNTCSGSVGVEIGWTELKKLSSPVWLKVSYEMWPFNMENFKEDLGGQLRKRWSSYGTLYLEEKTDQIWFAHITSEPISLDFQRVQLN